MKTILVPTDFSGCSMAAVEFGAHLAKKTGARLDLLHVIVPAESTVQSNWGVTGASAGALPPTEEGILMLTLMRETKLNMRKVKSMPYMEGVRMTDHIRTEGTVYDNVVDYAKKIDADIIIAGTHGASEFKEFFIGSNAEKIVRLADRPVLAVKHHVENTEPNVIVFASDFSEEAKLFFPIIKKFAEIYDAEIHLLRVNTPDDFETTAETTRKINSFTESFGGNYKTAIYNDTIKGDGIIDYANDVNADLIALGTHGRSGITQFFATRSVAEGVVNHSPRPVLSINIHQMKKALTEMEEVTGTEQYSLN